MTDNTQPDHIVDVNEMVTDTNQVFGIKVVIYDTEANLCEVHFDTNGKTITKNGIDMYALEAALKGVEAIQDSMREDWR